jgi:hypothetical protein
VDRKNNWWSITGEELAFETKRRLDRRDISPTTCYIYYQVIGSPDIISIEVITDFKTSIKIAIGLVVPIGAALIVVAILFIRKAIIKLYERIRIYKAQQAANEINSVQHKERDITFSNAIQISLYKNIHNSHESTCRICNCPFTDVDKVGKPCCCFNIFHSRCLKSRLRTDSKCPGCQQLIVV